MEGVTTINESFEGTINEDATKPEDLADYAIIPDSRSFLERTFGKLTKGALRGAIFALVSTAIGAGCLTLPLVFSDQGIVLGVLLITLAVYLSYYSLISIALAGERYKVYNYIMLTESVLGKNWKLFVETSIILYVVGTVIGYQIMIGSIVPSILKSLNIEATGSLERIMIMSSFNLLLMTPLSMFKELSSLRFVTLLSGFSLVYISLLVLVEFPFFASENSWSSFLWFRLDAKIISGFNLCLFSSTCHTNIPQIQGELTNSNMRRISKVSLRSMIAIYFPYMSLGVFGYLSTLGDTPSLIIMRDKPSGIPNDFLMVIARILMAITLTIGVPVNIPPCRAAISKSWLGYEEPPVYM
jgi:amino acid permease